MTVDQLVVELMMAQDRGLGSKPVKVWLPGSTITLATVSGQIMGWNERHKAVLIEGDVDAGSALSGER